MRRRLGAPLRRKTLLADGIDGAKSEMGLWSLAAVGAKFSGKPGFVLLADRAGPTGGGHAEDP